MSSREPSRGLDLLTAPPTLLMFIFGGVTMGVLGSAVYELLTNWSSKSNTALIVITAASTLALGGVTLFVRHISSRLRQPIPVLPDKRRPAPRRGLIGLVSSEETIRKALEHHRGALQWVWLVCSEQTLPRAQALRNEITENVAIVLIDDVYDPAECRCKIDDIYTHLPDGLTESEVILDFTGMTSVASVGAVLACLNAPRPMQFTPGKYNPDLKKPQVMEPIEVVLHGAAPQVSEDR